MPEGYTSQMLVRQGDPLFSDGPAFYPENGITLDGQRRATGDNTDGMKMVFDGNHHVSTVNTSTPTST